MCNNTLWEAKETRTRKMHGRAPFQELSRAGDSPEAASIEGAAPAGEGGAVRS